MAILVLTVCRGGLTLAQRDVSAGDVSDFPFRRVDYHSIIILLIISAKTITRHRLRDAPLPPASYGTYTACAAAYVFCMRCSRGPSHTGAHQHRPVTRLSKHSRATTESHSHRSLSHAPARPSPARAPGAAWGNGLRQLQVLRQVQVTPTNATRAARRCVAEGVPLIVGNGKPVVHVQLLAHVKHTSHARGRARCTHAPATHSVTARTGQGRPTLCGAECGRRAPTHTHTNKTAPSLLQSKHLHVALVAVADSDFVARLQRLASIHDLSRSTHAQQAGRARVERDGIVSRVERGGILSGHQVPHAHPTTD